MDTGCRPGKFLGLALAAVRDAPDSLSAQLEHTLFGMVKTEISAMENQEPPRSEGPARHKKQVAKSS